MRQHSMGLEQNSRTLLHCGHYIIRPNPSSAMSCALAVVLFVWKCKVGTLRIDSLDQSSNFPLRICAEIPWQLVPYRSETRLENCPTRRQHLLKMELRETAMWQSYPDGIASYPARATNPASFGPAQATNPPGFGPEPVAAFYKDGQPVPRISTRPRTCWPTAAGWTLEIVCLILGFICLGGECHPSPAEHQVSLTH
jgi:hypothetical protein